MHQGLVKTALVAGLASVVLWAAPVAAASPLHTLLDGRELQFDVSPVIASGRTLVPVRALLSAMGADITWDAATQVVGLGLGNVAIQLTIGSDIALVNGAEVKLDVPAQIIDGRTLVPLRFVSETLGARVAWDDATQTINISSRGGVAAARGDRTVVLVVTDGPLRVRSGPGTTFGILKELATGTRVSASLLDAGWWRVKLADGTAGYLSADYVALAPTGAPPPPPPPAPSGKAGDLVAVAMKQLGADYSYGGITPSGFDCSGFTSYVFGKFGVDLPHSAAEQAQLGKAVDLANLQPGDLMFWNTEGGISHVGIYVGNGNFIHAENPSTGVILTAVNRPYWAARYVTARRILP